MAERKSERHEKAVRLRGAVTASSRSAAEAGREIAEALAFGGHRQLPDATGYTCHRNAVDADVLAASSWMHLLKGVDPCVRDGRACAVTNMSSTVVRLASGGVVAAGCAGARPIPSIVAMVLTRHLAGGWAWAKRSLRDGSTPTPSIVRR